MTPHSARATITAILWRICPFAGTLQSQMAQTAAVLERMGAVIQLVGSGYFLLSTGAVVATRVKPTIWGQRPVRLPNAVEIKLTEAATAVDRGSRVAEAGLDFMQAADEITNSALGLTGVPLFRGIYEAVGAVRIFVGGVKKASHLEEQQKLGRIQFTVALLSLVGCLLLVSSYLDKAIGRRRLPVYVGEVGGFLTLLPIMKSAADRAKALADEMAMALDL
jgi:hypothetical protein